MNNSNIRLVLLVSMMLLMTVGCKTDCYRHEVKEIDFVNVVRDTVSLDLFDYKPLGLSNIATFDDYLFVLTNDPKGQLKIYDIDDGKEEASICIKGRAENEFISTNLMGEQYYYDGEDLILPLIDNYTILKEVNITQSIKQGKTVVRTMSPCINPVNGAFALLNNDIRMRFIFERPSIEDDICYPARYYLSEASEEPLEIPVYKDVIKGDNKMTTYSQYVGPIGKHPTKNLIIQPLQNMKYVLFFDLDNDKYYAIHQIDSRIFEDDVIAYGNYNPDIIVFGDIAVSNDYFFVTYCEKFLENPDSGIKSEIVIFDWDGNYIGGFISDIAVHRITYNEKKQILFCADIDGESLYQIKLNSILK